MPTHHSAPASFPWPAAAQDAGATPVDPEGGGALIHAAEAAELPTSFGVFKPVDHVMVGLPSQAQLDALVVALHAAGWPAEDVRQFAPRESVDELRAMVANAGVLAGFGYELTMLRRYLVLAEAGTCWLLVRAVDPDRAAAVAAAARPCGATMAVVYRSFTVEELIP